jgi:hypothetical protein
MESGVYNRGFVLLSLTLSVKVAAIMKYLMVICTTRDPHHMTDYYAFKRVMIKQRYLTEHKRSSHPSYNVLCCYMTCTLLDRFSLHA